MMASNFSALGLSDWLARQTSAVGFKEPTPIQENCIPAILEGKLTQHESRSNINSHSFLNFLTGQDCLGCAKTGSGKTAAFALPILQKLSEDPYGVFALVITPTR